MTIVGDLAQRAAAAGTRAWGELLGRYVGDRWTHRRLTVNYRMPAEVMEVAAAVLAEVDPGLEPPSSVRSTGIRPWARQVDGDALAAAVAEEVAARRDGDGLVAVIAPPEVALPVPSLTPAEAKGLEFDVVLVVEPARITAAGSRGPADLYVALTRATRELGVVHARPLPAALAGLEPRQVCLVRRSGAAR